MGLDTRTYFLLACAISLLPTSLCGQERVANSSVELVHMPDVSIEYLGYRPAKAIEWHGDTAVVLIDEYSKRIEIRNILSGSITRFGRQGGGPGEFRGPVDIAVNENGGIYVVDVLLNRLSRFSASGIFQSSYKMLHVPITAMYGGGQLYVMFSAFSSFVPAEGEGPAISVLDTIDGEMRELFEFMNVVPQLFDPPDNATPSTYRRPIAVSANGDIFVGAYYKYQIAKISVEGNVLSTIRHNVPLEYPNAAEIKTRERKIREVLRNAPESAKTIISDNPEYFRNLRRTLVNQPKRFFISTGFAVDQKGNLWAITGLRGAESDSSRIDHFPAGATVTQKYMVRDKALAISISGGRAAVLVKRVGDNAFGRFGLDIYAVQRNPANRN